MTTKDDALIEKMNRAYRKRNPFQLIADHDAALRAALAVAKPVIRAAALGEALIAVHATPCDSEALRAIRALKSKGQKP